MEIPDSFDFPSKPFHDRERILRNYPPLYFEVCNRRRRFAENERKEEKRKETNLETKKETRDLA